MLVVIAVIGIIAAIAVPHISSISQTSHEAKNKRNAQEIVKIVNAASVAGHDFLLDTSATNNHNSDQWVYLIIDKVVRGKVIDDPSSIFVGSYFGLPGLEDHQKEGARKYLKVHAGMLVYEES